MIKSENKFFIYDKPLKIDYKYYLKRILIPFYDILFHILILFINKKNIKKKYSVSICAIFKNEAHNFKEWIEFHKIVGVEHFYLYNNFSEDNYLEILKPYIENNIVTIVDWPFEGAQFTSYKHFYDNYKNETEWVSFLDLDEFITPLKSKTIQEWLKEYANFPCIVLYWKMFGTSGKIEHDFDKLTIEQYTVCWNKLNTVGKVLLNTNYNIYKFDSGVHHATEITVKFLGITFVIPPINEFKFFLKWDVHRTSFISKVENTIQINHYWSKSFQYYFKNKVARGDINNHERTINTFYIVESKATDQDFNIFKYVIQLKIALGLSNS